MDTADDEQPERPAPGPDAEQPGVAGRPLRQEPDDGVSARGWQARLSHVFRRRPARLIVSSVVLAVPRWVLRLGLPLLFIGAMVHSLPNHTTVQGVPLQVQATVFSRPGLSADTTVGSWVFPAVDGLPLGSM